jgi:hypothetical protein
MKRGKSYEWIPLWIDKWLMGSTRFELEPGERSVFIDLMVLGAKDDGYIRANVSMGYPHEYLARTLNVSAELLDSSIAKCIQHGKIKELKNGVYYVKNWESYSLSQRHKKRVMSQKYDTASRKSDALSVSVLSKSSSLSFNKNLKVWEGITEKDRAGWGEAYPACDIDVELARMKEWILSNPAKGKKSNYRRFITSWLSRTQDRGGSGPGGDNGGRRKPDPPQSGKYIPPTAAEKELEKKLLAEFEQAKKKYMAVKGYKTEDDIPFDELETFAMFKARRLCETTEGRRA